MNKIIFSSTLTEAPWGKWPAARIVKQNAEDAIRTLKNQPGKDIVIWGSLQFCQSILKSGLVDEYSLTICPTLIGKGKRLFPEDFAMSNLKRLDTKNFDLGAVHIRYQVK